MTLKSNTKPKKTSKKPTLLISAGYRYNIKTRLAALSAKDKNDVMIYVTMQSQSDYETVRRHITELKGSFKRNNILILTAFAKKFKCTIDELINK